MRDIKFLLLLVPCLFFLASEGREIVLPQTPFSTYEDTEGTISLPFPVLQENDREFFMSLSMVATTSNHLEVALGSDKNRIFYRWIFGSC